MSEVIVAIVSSAILIPEETMVPIQWIGVFAIVLAGFFEVLFGFSKSNQLH